MNILLSLSTIDIMVVLGSPSSTPTEIDVITAVKFSATPSYSSSLIMEIGKHTLYCSGVNEMGTPVIGK